MPSISGIPLTRTLSERTCGVWVDTRNGAIVAFLRFEQAVQEIFAVAVLPDLRFPDVINDDEQLMGFSFALPDAALEEVQIPRVSEHAEEHQRQGIAPGRRRRRPPSSVAGSRCSPTTYRRASTSG